MLETRIIHSSDGIELADVACSHRAGPGVVEPAGGHALVLVRRGCFTRTVEGVESLLDPTVAYFMNPGQEQRYGHPRDGGDDCTWIGFEPRLVLSVWAEEATLPSEAVPVPPELDVAHRFLRADASRANDSHAVQERAILLLASALGSVNPKPVESGRPRTVAARRALADAAREALAADLDSSLLELSSSLAVSPHHLSRVFRSVTGVTLARYRMRLRIRMALERLDGGEHDVARLASEVGFADQSHLCRVMRDEYGSTPGMMRRALDRQ